SISPPAGAKVVKIATPQSSSRSQAKQSKPHQHLTGVRSVAKHLSFSLAAPTKLVGLPRQSVSLLDWNGTPAALVSYGQNLGGIAVIEQKAQPKSHAPAASSQGGDRPGLTLPT